MTGVATLIAGDQLMHAVAVDANPTMDERALDEVLADSFPASDPPPWTLGVATPASSLALPHEVRGLQAGSP
jgi:hypothetical protein